MDRNVFMIDNQAMVVLKSEHNKSAETLLCVQAERSFDQFNFEFVFKADDKFEVLVLDRKTHLFHIFLIHSMFLWMKTMIRLKLTDAMGNALNFLEEGMTCELVFYNDKMQICQHRLFMSNIQSQRLREIRQVKAEVAA